MEKGRGSAQTGFFERMDLGGGNDEWKGKPVVKLGENHLRRNPASDVRSSLRLLRIDVLWLCGLDKQNGFVVLLSRSWARMWD